MADESRPIRVRAFVGRSFDPSDEGVWFEIRKVLESLRPLGLVFEDAQEAQLRPISEKVRQGIERNDVYIGILTRRRPVEGARPTANAVRRLLDALRKPASPSQWTSSEWVVQESGFALGREKQVILMIEQGVVYPTADLDADTEWIPFDRGSVPDCSLRLVQMINNLIAEKLPIVAAQVLVAPPPGDGKTEEKPEEAPGRVDEFNRVMTLLKQKQFTEADQVFTAYLTAQPEGTFKQWLPYFYLRQKYFKGDPDSLPKLKDAVLHEPENFYARAELARCYRSFKAYKEAARVLLEGADIVPARFKPQLLQRAAQDMAEDKQYERSRQIIVELLRKPTDGEELHSALLTLADIAKHQNDRDLESAALERALDINPAALDVRFRLAYLYSEMNKHGLAIYHYKLRVEQDRDPIALNNLGVSFAALDLPGKEIEMYEASGAENDLARANLSHAYIDRGFVKVAADLAAALTRGDETARDRAASALERISKARSKENQIETGILTEAKAERDFRAAFAIAFAAPPGIPINGTFETRYGKIPFLQEGDKIVGDARFREEVPKGLAGLMIGLSAPAPQKFRIRGLRLDGQVFGQAGRFRLEIREEEEEALFSFPKSSVVEGLLILSPDGESFEVLEEQDKKVHIYRARKTAA